MTSVLADFIDSHEGIFVLTGAGVSTASGIPDYRDESGEWKHRRPMEFRDFIDSHASRQRYWAGSFIGWQRFIQAQPNPAHRALARLEGLGKLTRTVTQNVDGLHQRAGSRLVTELHGSLATVYCLDCGASLPRVQMQSQLLDANPALGELSAQIAPDGDACLQNFDVSGIELPECSHCSGVLKPAVVFFGETVAPQRVQECYDALQASDALLVVGSSLMVYSGFRFVRMAQQKKLPITAINLGKTRADPFIAQKIEQDCATALNAALNQLDAFLVKHGQYLV